MKSKEYEIFLNLKKKCAEVKKEEKKEKKEKRTYVKIFRPAQKNINYSLFDSSTYSILENMTKYKNKEINYDQLNLNISINISFILTKCSRKKNNIKNFDIYYPLNRISYNEKNLQAFIPFPNNFLNHKKKTKKNDISCSSDNDIKNISKKSPKSESSLIYDDENNSLSLISDDSLVLLNYSTNSKNTKENNRKIQKNFVRYKNLNDYIECPLIQNKNKQDKINEYIFLLDNIDNVIENDEIYKINLYQSKKRYSDNINEEKIIIDNFDIINEELSGNNLIFKEKRQEFINVDFNKKPKDIIVIIDKQDEISSSLKKKYKKIMNQNYISLMQKIYKRLIESSISKNKKINQKNIFLRNFKNFLLNIEISNKFIYEKILKSQIFSDVPISFDKFIQSFDIIICDNKPENMKQKYLFLLNILTAQEFLSWNKIELFFELIGCDCTYIETFSENLGDKLIRRYNAVYKDEEGNNILEKKYRIKKLRIVLESFFEHNQFNK